MPRTRERRLIQVGPPLHGVAVPTYQSWVLLGGPFLTLIMLLAIPFVGKAGERSPKRRPWVLGSVGVAALAILTMLQHGHCAPWSPVLDPTPLPDESCRSYQTMPRLAPRSWSLRPASVAT